MDMTPPTTSNEPSEQAWQAAKEIHFEYSEEWIIECRNRPTASLHKYEALFFEAQEKRTRIALIIDAAFSAKLRFEFNRGKREAEIVLRRLLAWNYSGASLYQDDGELQDNRIQPFIDFKRDTPDEIEHKMEKRGMAILASIDEKGEGK